MKNQKEKKLSQNQLKELRELGFLGEDQIQKMIDNDFICGKSRRNGRRMMKMDNGIYTQPILHFSGKGRKTPYTDSMTELKREFEVLLEKYTELVGV
jgi:hypothetical protein